MAHKKSILLVHCHEISLFPPVLNLLENLLCNGHKVTLITKDEDDYFCIKNPYLRVIRIRPARRKTAAGNLLLHGGFQRRLKYIVTRQMRQHDVLWTTTDATVRELGDTVLDYCHVMQILELIRDIPKFPYQNRIMLHLERYAKKAWKVVVPEYNRAYIQQVLWNLDRTPVVLPNKPYHLPDSLTGRGSENEQIRRLEDEMEKESRRILLYQGVFEEDRDLTPFAEAAALHSDRCCLYVMGRDNEIRRKLCRQFPEVRYIPFLPPPDHLRITRHADFGLLPYIPVGAFHYSPLNALYCAPNKIFEYAAFGIPMLGTRVPGLEIPFQQYQMGICCDRNADSVVKALEMLSQNYDTRSRNSRRYYDSVDLDQIVEREILED